MSRLASVSPQHYRELLRRLLVAVSAEEAVDLGEITPVFDCPPQVQVIGVVSRIFSGGEKIFKTRTIREQLTVSYFRSLK